MYKIEWKNIEIDSSLLSEEESKQIIDLIKDHNEANMVDHFNSFLLEAYIDMKIGIYAMRRVALNG